MMKRIRIFTLCTVLTVGALFATACGSNNGNNNDTQAPYEDEVKTRGVIDDTNGAGSDLENAGKNLMDSIEDTGDAIRNGVKDMTDTNNNNNTDNNNNTNNNNNNNSGNGTNGSGTTNNGTTGNGSTYNGTNGTTMP